MEKMDKPRAPASPAGLTMLDAAALVLGAAVGSVHLRPFATRGLNTGDSLLFWPAFLGIALTASGPFILLGHQLARRSLRRPEHGEILWGILGLPWLLTSVLRASARSLGPRMIAIYPTALSVLLSIACLATFALVWRFWITPAASHSPSEPHPVPWTARVGAFLAIAWPLQGGLALIVVSPP